MKTSIFSLLTILFSLHAAAQNDHKKFKVRIEESHLGGNSFVLVTQDSIVSTQVSFEPLTIDLKQKVIGRQKEMLAKAFSNIEIEKLAADYSPFDGVFIDDDYDFVFTFEINGKTKKIHIYGGRQEQILKFVKQINDVIPICFQIHYDEKYLKVFEKARR